MALDAHQLATFRQLAATSPGVDVEVYRRFDKNPLDPIIGLGEIDARIGFMGRDPGRDEICHGEPFIGAGGQIVRRAIHQQLYGQPLPDFEASRALSRHFFWINTVPYKPVGNKAWSMSIKKRFHPAMTELLEHSWLGRDLITLGREAFLWFGIAQDKGLLTVDDPVSKHIPGQYTSNPPMLLISRTIMRDCLWFRLDARQP